MERIDFEMGFAIELERNEISHLRNQIGKLSRQIHTERRGNHILKTQSAVLSRAINLLHSRR